jgi:serpin B
MILTSLINSAAAESQEWRLPLKILKTESDLKENKVFSPISIAAAFSMSSVGAKGETRTQLVKVLGLSNTQTELDELFNNFFTLADNSSKKQKSAVAFNFANSLWPQVDYQINKQFLSSVTSKYRATVKSVDYKNNTETSRQLINGWVSENTKEKILNLIPPGVLNPLVRMTLVNAVYFKGKWNKQFDPRKTKEGDFKAEGGNIKAELMTLQDEFEYAENDNFQLIQLPYLDEAFSMSLLLPKSEDSIGEVIRKLDADEIEQLESLLGKQKIKVTLPKFKIESGLDLTQTFKKLGAEAPFVQASADFSGIAGVPHDLFISTAIHQAVIEVNEEGSEAAAATAIIMQPRSIPFKVREFKADHPFIFVIKKTGSPAVPFFGVVSRPTAN